MTPRTPSIVPFAVLVVVAAVVVPFLDTAIGNSSAYWASALLLTATLSSASLLLLLRRLSLFPGVWVAALWLIPVLILAVKGSPLVLLCVVPMLLALRQQLPNFNPPRQYALMAAVMLQGAFTLQLSYWMIPALLVLCAGIVLILWAKEPAAKPLDMRLVSGASAILLTFLLLSPGQILFPGEPTPKNSTVVLASTSNLKGSSSSAHLGIILKPDLKAVERKLPPPPTLQPQTTRSIPATPIDIPFSGVYWMFQHPLSGPPENSPVIVGSPGEGKYRSDDETPLRLDAHQSFNTQFPTRRLSAMDVSLLSNDTYPSTLWLEVIAYNSELPQYRISLGRNPIDFLPGAPQTLAYRMPASPGIDEFNELLLRVHLTAPRQFIAPRITIRKFRLYPR